MFKPIAIFFSYLFHPLLMPTYGMLLFLNIDTQLSLFISAKLKTILCLMTFAFTCVLPVINIWLLVKTKFISSVYMDKKEERQMAYLATLIFYVAEYFLLSNVEMFTIIRMLILGAALSLLITFIINFYWKISAHMTGIGGMAGALYSVNSFIDISIALPVVILLAGIIGFSRLALQAHNHAQVYAGFTIGFSCVVILFYFSTHFSL